MSTEGDKNETSRFLGDGVSFKAKLIGILEVSEARGDRMCQEALSDLKMAIRAAGEHKQRITINIAIDGLRLRDEKTGDSLYHHPVHKISFIAQDMTDSRAFGYIFGSPDTGHRFFGIKTDKAASQVVIAMRDLFQVVFALKKKEIELAKQHLDKSRYGTTAGFSDSSATSKVLSDEASNKPLLDSKGGSTRSDMKTQGPAVADLVDLELELNSLQQGISQMERITPSDPYGSKDDPFGDSFIAYPPKPILPPPPSGRERSSRTSESSSLFSPKTPINADYAETINTSNASIFKTERSDYTFTRDLNRSYEEPHGGDWFTHSEKDKIGDEPKPMLVPETKYNLTKQEILSQFDVFTELDPLGRRTGKIRPYIDKKDFFQELKNPPKKVLNDLLSEKQPQEIKLFNANFEELSSIKPDNTFNSDPFGEDPFDTTDPFAETEFSRQDPFDTDHVGMDIRTFNKNIKPSDFAERFKFPPLNSGESIQPVYHSCLSKSPIRSSGFITARSLQFSSEKPIIISEIHDNRSLDMSSESECAPEPPPRPTSNILQMKPPPLPPKKQPGEICMKPPPRPPYSDDSHYDYMDSFEMATNSLDSMKRLETSPPLPAPVRKAKFETAFINAPQRPKKQFNVQESWSSEEDYLTPISFPQRDFSHVTESVILPPPKKNATKHTQEKVAATSYFENKPNTEFKKNESANPLEGLDITLSQLTISGLNELAVKLNISQSQLSNMTLVQLTEFVSNFIKNKSGDISSNTAEFKADFANFNNFNEEPQDKYAVFRELLQEEIKQTKIDTEPEEHIEERKKEDKLNNLEVTVHDKTDRYAALREIVDNEINQTIAEDDDDDEDMEDYPVDVNEDVRIKNESNIINTEEKLLTKDNEGIIDYTNIKESIPLTPLKSPVTIKSPVSNIPEIIHTNNRVTSGSLSDIISGSSPEIDNTGSTSDVIKKHTDPIGESWAVFDQPNLSQHSAHDKHSEEGVSPWSSDSKEFGNGSPPEWNPTNKWECHRRDHEDWWDTSAEPEAEYYPQNRRSTDSYEDEAHEYYDRPSRRRHQGNSWAAHRQGTGTANAAGGHSSSSRDASPWEEEPRRRNHKESWSHHPRQHSIERQRRHADSWDEEDDYEYHWPERHTNREVDKDRHREPERWVDEWAESRRHRCRRDIDYDHWCCPDWEQETGEQPPSRYSTNRWRKHEDRYYSRESQKSPWEDDYVNESELQHGRYLSATMKRNWKRPNSASEMDRKTGEIKSRPGQYYLTTGGSDGERDRRYKIGRRTRSRDSQFNDARHKQPESNQQVRSTHRSKQHGHHKETEPKKLDTSKSDTLKKSGGSLGNRKKTKESSKTEEPTHTFSRKFENNFVPSETESPVSAGLSPRFTFENDFETSEAESPIVSISVKRLHSDNEQRCLTTTKKTTFKDDTQISPSSRISQKSPFDDDFSPTVGKHDQLNASSIKEETDEVDEEDDSLSANSFSKSTMRKKILCSKSKAQNNFRIDTNLHKSESINIFARENDPFDDEFFCESINSDRKWTDDFQNFDLNDSKK